VWPGLVFLVRFVGVMTTMAGIMTSLLSSKQGKKFRNFAAVVDFLEEKLGGTVDLVTREGLSPFIGPHILEEVEYASLAS
jgi:hypothetical protein